MGLADMSIRAARAHPFIGQHVRISPNGVTGKLYIAATDHRPDPDGACGRLWSNTCSLFVAEA
jgi:hypothetical protein